MTTFQEKVIGKKEDKYGDDAKFESWADNNIFFPINNMLVDPLYCMGFTPNMITILSTLFTFYSIYQLSRGNNMFASLLYIIGYVLDGVDGKMARRYSLGSDFGMVIDLVSDNISNIALFYYIASSRRDFKYFKSLIIINTTLSFMLLLSYGINEAIASYEATGDDNFYLRRVKQLKNNKEGTFTNVLYDLFLMITKSSYNVYKTFFPVFDKTNLFNWLNILKEFGPGNYCLFIGLLLTII